MITLNCSFFRLSGEQEGVFDLILHCMFVVPDYLPEQKRFDILVLSLTFLINLIEHCKTNRQVKQYWQCVKNVISVIQAFFGHFEKSQGKKTQVERKLEQIIEKNS